MPEPNSPTTRTRLVRRSRPRRFMTAPQPTQSSIKASSAMSDSSPTASPSSFPPATVAARTTFTSTARRPAACCAISLSPCQFASPCTLLDGLVLARSVFNHSMNYQSVVVLGNAVLVDDPSEKLEALRLLLGTYSSRPLE